VESKIDRDELLRVATALGVIREAVRKSIIVSLYDVVR